MTAGTVTNMYTAEPDRGTMDTVTVRKHDLLAALVANRAAHRAEFEKALTGYRDRSIKLLEEHIERIRKGKLEKVLVALPMPEDHTDDYDRTIMQMEWTVQDEIELTSRQFDQYVRDQWGWKAEFAATSSMYTSG